MLLPIVGRVIRQRRRLIERRRGRKRAADHLAEALVLLGRRRHFRVPARRALHVANRMTVLTQQSCVKHGVDVEHDNFCTFVQIHNTSIADGF